VGVLFLSLFFWIEIFFVQRFVITNPSFDSRQGFKKKDGELEGAVGSGDVSCWRWSFAFRV
jgi:hypothetical protein